MKTQLNLSRRQFVAAGVGAAGFAALPRFAQAAPEVRFEAHVPFRAITRGPNSHWFGYYDKLQFDETNRFALGMEVGFNDRSPKPDDAIRLGMIDLEDNDKWIELGHSSAWCWQQGCMLQWLPGHSDTVIYNARLNGAYQAVIQNVKTGEQRALPKPVYAVDPIGKNAVCPNFARLGVTRPGYGYNGPADPWQDELQPRHDGIYQMSLETGAWRLIISLDQIAGYKPDDTMFGAKHWFNHLLFSPTGERFIFLHRWERTVNGRRSWYTRMFTADADGGNLFCVADHDMVSHFIWKNSKQILAWSREPKHGDRFHLYTDKTDTVAVIGDGVLMRDGHCTYSPDQQWVLVDTYPDQERMQNLMLYRPTDGKLVKLGRFYQAPESKGEIRCDLHPSWSRDGRRVSIDSRHNGGRQIYLLDVSEITQP